MRRGLRYQLMQRWTEVDVTAAMAYANSLTDRQERELSIDIVAGVWAAARQQALNAVVQQWAQNDPTAAGQWLAALPDEPPSRVPCKIMSAIFRGSIRPCRAFCRNVDRSQPAQQRH